MNQHHCTPNSLPPLAQFTGWGRVPGWQARNGEVYPCPACGKLWKVRVRDTGIRVTRSWHPVKPYDLPARVRGAVRTPR